jgi:hypothetical protein
MDKKIVLYDSIGSIIPLEENKKIKVLLVGAGNLEDSALHITMLKEKYSGDIIVVTPEEAKEQNLEFKDFVNIPSIKIIAPPIISMQPSIELSGQERRNKRRERERKGKRKKNKRLF